MAVSFFTLSLSRLNLRVSLLPFNTFFLPIPYCAGDTYSVPHLCVDRADYTSKFTFYYYVIITHVSFLPTTSDHLRWLPTSDDFRWCHTSTANHIVSRTMMTQQTPNAASGNSGLIGFYRAGVGSYWVRTVWWPTGLFEEESRTERHVF